MKSNWQKTISPLIIGLLFICVVGIIVEVQSKFLRHTYDDYVLDNRNHYLPCKALPTKAEVERIVEQHQDIIQQIEQIAPGFVGIEIDSSTCPEKADLLIWYGSHQQRIAIEELISGDTFFGVPYRLQNR